MCTPAKTEVRFLREQEVFDCVHYGVLGALEQASGRVQMKLKPQNDGNSAFRTMSAAEYRAAAARPCRTARARQPPARCSSRSAR